MRDIDEPIKITCDKCERYGKDCHGEVCPLSKMFRERLSLVMTMFGGNGSKAGDLNGKS